MYITWVNKAAENISCHQSEDTAVEEGSTHYDTSD